MSTKTPEEVAREFGRRVASRRTHLGLSQQELAERIGVDSAESVSRYERGHREPRISTLLRFADALQVSGSVLLPASAVDVATAPDRSGERVATEQHEPGTTASRAELDHQLLRLRDRLVRLPLKQHARALALLNNVVDLLD